VIWIRVCGHRKYHAVFVDLDHAGVRTYCDRAVESVEIEDRTEEPRDRCTSCVRRLARPSTVPAHMRELLRTRNTAATAVWEELHDAFDQLLAAYLLANRDKVPSTTTAAELMIWSHQQTKGKP
jgi:hypothetical protein